MIRPTLSKELEQEIFDLKQRILTDKVQVLDSPSRHHIFASGAHGRKLDFDKIETGSNFFWQWVGAYANWINEFYKDQKPDIVVGIANGANRLATTMSASIGAVAVETQKVDKKTVALTQMARIAVANTAPNFALLIEDVGTTGGTTATVIPELQKMGVQRVEVAHTWIRSPELVSLDELGINYAAMIHEPLPTFSEADCMNQPHGFCFSGARLIPHGK